MKKKKELVEKKEGIRFLKKGERVERVELNFVGPCGALLRTGGLRPPSRADVDEKPPRLIFLAC